MMVDYDDETLAKVYAVLRNHGVTSSVTKDIVDDFQNRGLLFRERPKESPNRHIYIHGAELYPGKLVQPSTRVYRERPPTVTAFELRQDNIHTLDRFLTRGETYTVEYDGFVKPKIHIHRMDWDNEDPLTGEFGWFILRASSNAPIILMAPEEFLKMYELREEDQK